MKQKDTLGPFELQVLTAVVLLREGAYGMAVHEKVEQMAEEPAKIAAVYTTLERLQEKGYLGSQMADRSPKRTGKTKRYFHLLGAGAKALEESRSVWRRLDAALDEGLEEFGLWKPKKIR